MVRITTAQSGFEVKYQKGNDAMAEIKTVIATEAMEQATWNVPAPVSEPEAFWPLPAPGRDLKAEAAWALPAIGWAPQT